MKWFKRWVEKRFYKIHPELYGITMPKPTTHVMEIKRTLVKPINFNTVYTVYDEEQVPKEAAEARLKECIVSNMLKNNDFVNIREMRDSVMRKTDYYARVRVLPIGAYEDDISR